MKKPRRAKLTRRGIAFLLVYVLVLSGCVYTGLKVLLLTREQDQGEGIYAQFRLETPQTNPKESAVVEDRRPAGELLPKVSDPQVPEECITLRGFQAKYPEMVAWILIPDTPVDYPVMQAQDNQKYLDRMPDGSKNVVGSIFLDCRTSLESRNLILYGHNVGKGTMFGSLKKYKDPEYYAARPQFTLITADRVYACEIFSVHTANAYDSGIYCTKFSDDAEFDAFLTRSKEASLYEIPVVPKTGDQIVTLSTCTGGERTDRFVVQARIVSMDNLV